MGKKKQDVFITQLYPISSQLQAKCSRSGLSCLLRDSEDPWGSTDEETRHCSQAKRHLYQVIEEVSTQQEHEDRRHKLFRSGNLYFENEETESQRV